MGLINVQLEGVTGITQLEESCLRKTEGAVDNANEATTWVEYCLVDCDGPAHRTGTPDAPHLFCAKHVHRSVAVRLKRGVQADAAVGGVGGS